MSARLIRLKVHFNSAFTDQTYRYWSSVNLGKSHTIKHLSRDLLDTHFKHYEPDESKSRVANLKIKMEDFELPTWENTNILRDGDLVNVSFELDTPAAATAAATVTNADASAKKAPESSKKRKLDVKEQQSKSNSEPASKRIILTKSSRKNEDEWDEQTAYSVEEAPASTNNSTSSSSRSSNKFEAALVGSSMIRGINPFDVLPDKNVLFRSISGGRIPDLLNYLVTQEPYLKSCRLFIITIGSNDCDSHASMVKIYKDLNELAYYLDDKYPKARVLMNLLVPRPVCRYTKPDEFESRRRSFNEYIRVSLPNQLKHVALSHISHPAFEVDPQESAGQKILGDLLHDGVHISTDYGVPKYVADINNALKDLLRA